MKEKSAPPSSRFRTAILPPCASTNPRATPGNRGVQVLRRIRDDEAEFVLISHRDSLDAIRAFAGDDYERAVHYPDDKDYLLDFAPNVDHFEVFA